MLVDNWSQHQWTWALEEQKDYIRDVALHHQFAVRSETTDGFFKALRCQWFLRWSVIPELIWLDLLPSEAAKDSYAMSEDEEKLVSEYEDRRFTVSVHCSVAEPT